MTYVTHAYSGAVAYALVDRALGSPYPVAAPIVGGVLGSAPDVFDWIGARNRTWIRALGFIERSRINRWGLWPRWWLYGILHHNTLAILVEWLLLAPGIHVSLDRLIHRPVLPREGEDPSFDVDIGSLFGIRVRRRDVLWLTGELFVIALTSHGLWFLR